MGLQKGGHRLKQELRRMFSGDLFGEYILPMILHENTKFEILNTSSMYGFVVVMTVDIGISNFVNDDEDTVNKFVIKICELNSPNSRCMNKLRKAALPGDLFKKSLSRNMFLLEGKTQQKIWGERLELGLKPICPAFTSLKIIESRELIEMLVKTMFQNDTKIIDYLMREITAHSYDLGLMMMEKIEGVVLKSVPQRFDPVARFICAAAITLYLQHDVIDIDLNQGNVLWDKLTENITVIDFGQVMTPDFLTYCVNSRGDIIKTIDPKENAYALKQQKDNLTEFQKIQFFFKKGKDNKIIQTKNQIASMLTFLVHMELRILFMLHGPMANSNMTQIVEHALRGEDDAYQNILDIYQSLNTRVTDPKTPLKEFVKVGYTEEVPSVERPLEYFLKTSDLTKAEAEYKSMWIPAKTGKAVPSTEEFGLMVEKMRGQLSDDIAFQNAIKLGTPGSDEECTIVDDVDDSSAGLYPPPPPHSGSTIVDNSEDFNPFFSPHSGSTPPDNSNDLNPFFSPHSGSTIVDNSNSLSSESIKSNEYDADDDNANSLSSGDNENSAVFNPPRIPEATRPDKKRRHDGFNKGGRPRIYKTTRRKKRRRTVRHILRKRKSQKQCKQKTRKYTKIV